ncbi:tectonic [Wyeomyia smithii]|uniref:tectonic n=1 Tax=Wyeomyia smithii TaxID=174621 RepID=UPI002467F911|nr:tectonic [Wyeomyia smithii]
MELSYIKTIAMLIIVFAMEAYQERQMQSFVKIDVSKVNQKISNKTTTVGAETSETTQPTTSSSTTVVTTSSTGKPEVTTKSQTVTTTSTTTPGPTSTSSPDIPKEGRLMKSVPSGYYCSCDLKINICDVNCCCDIDCTDEILKSFDCDEEQLDIAEYHNQMGLQSCEVQGGLFCLVGEPQNKEQETFYDKHLKTQITKHKWADVFPVNDIPKEISPTSYRVNDPIRIYNESSEQVELFSMPFSLTNSNCQLMQPVRFLQDYSVQCLQSIETLETFTTNFVEQQTNIRYQRLPKLDIMEHCIDQDCFNGTFEFCNLAGRDCQRTNRTESFEQDGLWYCPELRVIFIHNYTRLEEVSVRFHCGLLQDYTDQNSNTIWQKISIQFKRRDEEKFSRQLSGNLGYLMGKPIIVSRVLIPENDTAEEKRSKNYMLAYFTNDTRDADDTFRLKLPISRRNRCVFDHRRHYDIVFGESSWNKCNFSPRQNVTNESNLTAICSQLQEGILNLLLHNIVPRAQPNDYETLNLFLSKYGNPINRSDEWIQLKPLNVINENITAEWPSTRDKQTAAPYFTCKSMIINVKYNFYHARTTVQNVPRQQVLQEAELVFGPRVDLQFTLEDEIRVPIYAQVQFFDLTSHSTVSLNTLPSKWVLVINLAIIVSFKVFA